MADNNNEGLSKGQQKKMAKKAEKQAKKGAAASGGGGGGSAPAAAPAASAPAAASASSNAGPAPVWKIGFPSANNTSTVKVAMAAQLFGVNVQAASKSQVLKASRNDFFATTSHGSHPVLWYGNAVVGGGGNSMAKALRYANTIGVNACVPAVDLLVDEWCEWERNVLRAAAGNEKQVAACLAQLETALSSKEGALHIVGNANSLADVVMVVTLHQILQQHDNQVHVPLVVATYLAAHELALQNAQRLAQTWHDESATPSKLIPLDLEHPSLQRVLTAICQQAALPLLNGDEELLPDPKAMVTKCGNAKHGDYQLMAAMPMFAALKKANALPATINSPQQVALALIANIEADERFQGVIQDLNVQGPGFVVFRVQGAYLQKQVAKWLSTGQLPKPTLPVESEATLNCVVDFSSPNIAKEMHVGHLRSTIIGEAVCRILEFVGYHVHRTNHVGDWGTQFGMLIQYLKEEYPEVATSSDDAQLPNITDLTVFYKNAKQRFDDSPDFKKTAQTNVVALQSGDAECLKIWKMLCDVSRQEFQKVYTRLDVTLEEKGESFYNDRIPPVIEEFNAAGLVSIEEGGAKCVFVDGMTVPVMLQKSDGGFGYDSTDMAALKYRLQEVHALRIIVITDFSQADHFKLCFGAARKIGWVNDKKHRLDHIGFGTVMGEDGKRFKTRSGDTVRLVDLLDEAVQRMEDNLKGRIEEGKANITMEEVHEVAEAIGYGAVKYFDLRRNPTSNYKFSYDQMLDTKGNTAVYLLYARVRLESICAKAKAEHGVDVEELVKACAAGESLMAVEHESERNLVLNLHLFADMMETTLEDLLPYHICEYVYNVSIAASDFVTQCKVLGSPEMKSRLLLCHATIVAMHQCFDLLGIRHVKRI